ncbi:MAG: type II toxin-antitoxin system VapC family toxin [Bacteroidia bacterium]|nr:type II toxin-antitoxin system VapC family toxin [Bacteroidia bacterium]
MEKKRKVLADSNLLIDAFRGKISAKKKLENNEFLIVLSDITLMELYAGCNSIEKRTRLEEQLKYYATAPITNIVAEKAISLIKRYVKNYQIHIPDIIIAATSLHYGLPLITSNKRDFEYIKEIILI